MSDTYQTNGLVDLIGRRALWGEEKVRVLDVLITVDGAFAQVRLIKNGKEKQLPVEKLRLVPMDQMPAGPEWEERQPGKMPSHE